MAANKRNEKQKADDRTLIANWMVQNKTVRKIRELLNENNEQKGKGYSLSLGQVAHDMKNILQEWQDERKEFIDYVVDRELKKLDIIEAECWVAWDKSKLGKKTTKFSGGQVSATAVSGGKIKERSLEETSGDVKYLDKIFDCMDRRKDLLGYAAAKKVEFSGSIGVGVTPMSEDEILKEKERITSNLRKVV